MLVFFADGRTPSGLEWRRIGAFIGGDGDVVFRSPHEHVLSQAPADEDISTDFDETDSDASTAAP